MIFPFLRGAKIAGGNILLDKIVNGFHPDGCSANLQKNASFLLISPAISIKNGRFMNIEEINKIVTEIQKLEYKLFKLTGVRSIQIPAPSEGKKRKLSQQARKRISEAQKRRWRKAALSDPKDDRETA